MSDDQITDRWDIDSWKQEYTVSDDYICSNCASKVREYDDNKPGQAFKCFECANIGRATNRLIGAKLDGLLRI
jgi:DNA-directed RNA polymerase subunit RPC12/RpoP